MIRNWWLHSLEWKILEIELKVCEYSNDSNINLEFVFEFRWNLEMLQILSSSVEQQEDVDQTRWPHMEDYSNIALLKVLFT